MALHTTGSVSQADLTAHDQLQEENVSEYPYTETL